MAIELPPEPVHFVNRDEERARALRAVEEWRGRSRPLVLALSGPGGSGKTELAYLIARTLSDRFPDGVFTVDLDDYRLGGQLDAGDVLARLLLSLGADPQWLAPQFAARCRQYWSMTEGRRLVLILDNARYASEVTPLLPASGGSVVIVASHGPLYDLEAGSAVELGLPPLTDAAALELLHLIVQDRRMAADPEAATSVVRLCGGFPAALHVAARWVRTHPLRPLPRLVADLRAELDEKGVPVVERVWDAAYGDLSGTAALLYRLLPGHPGTTFSRESVTALLGLGPDAADDALEELGTAGLLDTRLAAEKADGRVRLPELLRAHARRRARRDGTEAELAEAQARFLRWLVRQAQRADRFAAGGRLLVSQPVGPIPDCPDVPLDDPEEAQGRETRIERARGASRWLYEERHLLSAGVRLAHARAADAEAIALCEPVWTYALDHPHQTEVIEVFRLGVESAVRLGDVAAMVRMRCQLARHLWESERLAEAGAEVGAAMAALDLLGGCERDRKLRASAIEFRGMLHSARGDWAAAAEDFARCREEHRAIPNPYGVLLQTYRLGQAQAELGDLATASRLLAEAHAEAKAQHRDRITARTGFALGGVLCRLGRTAEARALYEASLTGARSRGSGVDEARILDAFAELAAGEGQDAEAEGYREAAREIRQRNGRD